MTVGLSVATANAMLDTIGSTYLQMHFDDPGADGTSNVALLSERVQVVFDPAANAVRTLSSGADWPSAWSGESQRIGYLSVWSSSSGGTFIASLSLPTKVLFSEGIVPRVGVLSLTIPSLAAD